MPNLCIFEQLAVMMTTWEVLTDNNIANIGYYFKNNKGEEMQMETCGGASFTVNESVGFKIFLR